LYDTYGFPYELAEEVVAREGLAVDRPGFDAAMAEARAKAREGAKMKGDVFAKGPLQEVKKLTTSTEFTGYDGLRANARVIAVVKGDALSSSAAPGDQVTVVLDKTPFYGESGGQVGDTGLLVGGNNLVVRVEDTQKINNIFLHIGEVESGTLSPGMEIAAEVDAERRLDIMRNHTTAHLLHNALRAVLGDKAEQKGSYVGPDRLRFDFQHASALSSSEKEEIEELVNRRILENAQVVTRVMTIDEARKLGAIALFGEKYGETVRVLSTGDYSVELCGGTHMKETAPIGSFRLVAEESVAAGVRRIEGVTGLSAFRLSQSQGEMIAGIARELKTPARDAIERVQSMAAQIRELEKTLASVKTAQARGKIREASAEDIGTIRLLAVSAGEIGGKELGDLAREAVSGLGVNGVVVLAGHDNGKAALAVAVGKGLAPLKLKAGDIVKKLAVIIGGGGGGKPDFAQAGGKEPDKLPEMLRAAPEVIGELLQ
jgi:Alanyl-tRNA synthetase